MVLQRILLAAAAPAAGGARWASSGRWAARVAAGLAVSVTLLLGPTARPLAAWLGVPMSGASCACPPASCRCPHGASLHGGGAASAAGAEEGAHGAGRPSCPLRAGHSSHAAASADASQAAATAHPSHAEAAGPSHADSTARGSHAAAAGRHHHSEPVRSTAVTAAGSGHLAPATPADASSGRCSIASRCGGDGPAATGSQAWLQADLGPGTGWAAPAGPGDPSPPAAAARLLDLGRSPELPPPRRIAPIA